MFGNKKLKQLKQAMKEKEKEAIKELLSDKEWFQKYETKIMQTGIVKWIFVFGDVPMLQTLIASGYDIHGCDAEGKTLLDYGIKHRFFKTGYYVFTLPLDFHHKDIRGENFVAIAIRTGNIHLIDRVLSEPHVLKEKSIKKLKAKKLALLWD